MRLKTQCLDFGGKPWSFRIGQGSSSVWGSSTSSQAPEAPELWLGHCWNLEQTQKCLREMGTRRGEDPVSESPTRKDTADKHQQGIKDC